MTDLQIIKELIILKKLSNKSAFYRLKKKFGEFESKVVNNKVIMINLSSKDVKSEDLELIGELTSLEELYLGHKQVDTIQSLEGLTNLKVLWFKCNKIAEIQGLDKLTKLESLYLVSNEITEIEVNQFKTNNTKLNIYLISYG